MDIHIDIAFRLNFNNLDLETQEMLMKQSKLEIEYKFGDDLKNYGDENSLDYDSLLEEEAIKNLYNHKFNFTI